MLVSNHLIIQCILKWTIFLVSLQYLSDLFSDPVSIPQSTSFGNFVSQASLPEDYSVQSSKLLESATTNLVPSKSEGIPVSKILPADDEEDKTTVAQTSNDVVDTKPADSSEIRKRRLERLTSKEATCQQSVEATQDDDDVTDT